MSEKTKCTKVTIKPGNSVTVSNSKQDSSVTYGQHYVQNMPEYIEREELYKKLHEAGGCDADKGSWADGWDKGIDEAIRLLKNQPAADVAEVVRCKDCAFGRTDDEDESGSVMCFCRNAPWDNKYVDYFTMSPLDYCSYGKRKTVIPEEITMRYKKFISAQEEAEKFQRKHFTCPLCGGSAWWERSEINNHLCTGCRKCGFRLME